jgi:glycosyltransferase involved in cell wall biosynthesis
MITLCMIVKNEEENLKNCLNNVALFVDEIIVVDTGSIDRAKSIALEFTNKVYDFEWGNDFSAARNFSILKATNDWILVLDADEYLSQFNNESISTFIGDKSNENKVGRIERINILEDGIGDKRYTERISRLFNKKYFQYEGTIHEQIVSKDGTAYNAAPIDITAYHIGYTKEAVDKTNKLKRNMDMLIKAIENNPNDPYLYFQLGKTNYMIKDYVTSCSYFEKALSFQLDSRLEYVEDLIETYGYALINSSRYSDAMNIENYLEFYSNSADFHFLLGLIYMNNAKFTQAIESFLECTKFSQGKMEGITTFLPYYNIGVIYEVLGLRDKAKEYYKLCGNYSPAIERLNQLNK